MRIYTSSSFYFTPKVNKSFPERSESHILEHGDIFCIIGTIERDTFMTEKEPIIFNFNKFKFGKVFDIDVDYLIEKKSKKIY